MKKLPKQLKNFINSDKLEGFELSTCPGLLIIKNAFTTFGIRYLTARCLRDYPLPPNQTNLKTKNLPADVEANWWSNASDTKTRDSLRWVTLGLHHDWDSKIYNDTMKNDFPHDLAQLVQAIANALGFHDYQPEAAIVNYYPMNTTLAGHTDHSEYCMEPLFSISLGQSAVFLIGGRTKEEPANAILLEHGDVVVMTSDSRMSYHAIPRIISTDIVESAPVLTEGTVELTGFDQDLITNIMDQNFWQPFYNYLSHYRININVRQVFKK